MVSRGLMSPVLVLCVSLLGSGLFASDYFPKVMSCGTGAWDYQTPPADVLARAKSKPSTPLFTQAFESLSKSAIKSKWLPSRFDDAKYLTYGEGTYRAENAHLYKSYKKYGYDIALKRSAHALTLVVSPMPFKVTPEAQKALDEASKQKDECYIPSPYIETGAPVDAVKLIESIRDEFLTPACAPISEKNWAERARDMYACDSWLGIQYQVKGALYDAGANGDIRETPVTIWTNGKMFYITIGLAETGTGSKLFSLLNSGSNISIKGLNLPYVSKISGGNSWTDANGDLVPFRKQATHKKIDYDLKSGQRWDWRYYAIVPNTPGKTSVQEGAWFCLAKSCAYSFAGNIYYSQQGNWNNVTSPKEVLQELKQRRDNSQAAYNRLDKAPVPKELAGTRKYMLSKFGVEITRWNIAWREWNSGLKNSSKDHVDYEALSAKVDKAIASKGLPKDRGYTEIVDKAEKSRGIITDDMCGD